MTELLIPIFVFILAAANGANDISKGVATLVGGRALRPQTAILWGTFLTGAGALVGGVVGASLLRTFSSALLSQPISSPLLPLAMALSAIVWLFIATRLGMPISTTHALVGGLIGAAWAQTGSSAIVWEALLQKAALPLALSPVMAAALTRLSMPIFRRMLSRTQAYCLCLEVQHNGLAPAPTAAGPTLLAAADAPKLHLIAGQAEACEPKNTVVGVKVQAADALHIFTSGLTSFARGMNDAPKIAALLLSVAWVDGASAAPALGLAALGMCLGSLLWGRRVLHTLSEKITAMDSIEALSANACSSILVSTATFFGMPLSTTHVTTSAIVGIGLEARRGIDWRVVREIILAWAVTLPTAGVLAYYFNLMFQQIAF